MADKKAKVLTAQRQILEAKLKRVHEFAKNLRNDEIMEAVNIRLKDSREIIIEIKDLDMDLLKLNPEEPIDATAIEVIYYDIETKLGSWLRKYGSSSADNANETLNASQVTHCHEPRLPKTVIPVFDGNYMDWPSFYDLYCSNFHDRPNLTPSQKFQYLRGYLKGEASNLIKHLPITDANYLEAFDKLRERYSRKKQIVNSYIGSFLDQRSVQTPTANSLRQLMDNSDEILRGLKALGSEAESRDPWIIRLLLNKLDGCTREKWADETKGDDFPTIKKLFDFLQGRIDALEDVKTFHNFKKLSDTKPQPIRGHLSATNIMCPCCQKDEHKLYLCDQFKQKPINERREFIQSDRRCFNCLNINHSVFNCLSKKRCTKCKRKHHTLLHPEPETTKDQQNQPIASIPAAQTHVSEINPTVPEISCAGQEMGSQTILPTAIARFSTLNSQTIGKCRILLDSASQVSFASEAFVRRFKLPTIQRRIPVAGIGGTSAGATKGYIRLQLMNEDDEKIVTVNAYVLPKVTAKLPHQEFCWGNKTYFKHIQLADPYFNVPSEIDLLVGADQFFNILEDGQMKNEQHEIIAQNTKFGWVIAGKPPVEVNNHSITSLHSLENIESYLRAMWETEAVPNQIPLTSEENRCENFYTSTTTKSEEGRYIVRLPFREEPTTLGNSIGLAIGRLRSLERRFTTDAQFAEMYRKFMNEYLTLGHMRRIKSSERKQSGYYLPHHGILKATGGDIKMRVVFDASAKSSTGKSLNDMLMVGPTVQSSLYSILVRFRTHKFVFTADLQKMYRQIVVAPEDRKWQKIVWRDSQHNPIEHFELITVTYGTAAAPFLATRTINQIAMDNRTKYPLASREILENVYVDDIMTGANTVVELCKLKKTIEKIFQQSGMTLGKWVSNCPEILEMLSPAQISNTIEIKERCDAAKVLGLCWNPIQDVLTFSAQFESNIKYTKRTLLSEASRVFDPLGLVAPCIVPIKTLFQHLWKTKLDWDEELPKELKDQWTNIREDISDLSSITIPRWLSITSNMEFEIHGFCDASEAAYGAVFYSRHISEFKECMVSLITSKSKVAPVKYLTIPKLELSAAVLLAKMWNVLKEDLKYVKIRSVTVWTDSSIVLDWLSSTNKIKDVFVRNRVAAILDVLSREHWNHIKSENNPADILSRGSTVSQLVNCNLWWRGPSYLNDPNKTWPTIISVVEDAYAGTVSTQREADWLTNVCNRVSSFFKIVMIIARVQRWFKNAKIPRELRSFKISVQDISFAELVLIQRLQEEYFHEEIAQLKTGTVIKRNSTVKNLNPFLDVHHVMRVGGRISNSIVNFNTSHPIILPRESSVVKKLVEEYHIQYRHAGPTLLSNILKQKYYIMGGRKLTRYVAQKCIQCCRARPTLQMQLMAELPAARVQFQKPFAQVGVDYAGPFSAYHVRRRGQRSVKVYVCLFVCLATKSVHIELASDMTTEAFLGAWKRMTARRGCCSDIYSDCGSNFIGASRQLKEWHNMLKENSNLIASFLLRQKVTWHFNPPSAPHFGGLWEAAVKSFKTHLRRVIGDNIPTIEEFHTLIVEIEGILNSRPLCRGEGDVDVLTPAHFLIGQPITNLPEHHIPTKTINNNDRWKMVQQMAQHFWSRWHREYLVTLQHRYKWQHKDRNVEVNDIVIIKNENTSSTRWPLGRVICTHPGADGMVRAVTLSTQGGNIKRPIHKLSILLSSESNDSREAGC